MLNSIIIIYTRFFIITIERACSSVVAVGMLVAVLVFVDANGNCDSNVALPILSFDRCSKFH